MSTVRRVQGHRGFKNALLVQKDEQRILLEVLRAENHMKIPIYNMRIKMPENCLVLEVCFYTPRSENVSMIMGLSLT